jgi:prevent-host-death family protein
MNAKEIGVFEAKTHLSEVLEQVEAGQVFIVTRRGKPVAELRPVTRPRRPLTRGCGRNEGYWMAPDFDDVPEDFEEYV